MSDIMTQGVIRMPYEQAMGDELSRYQFYQRAQQVLDERNEALAKLSACQSDSKDALPCVCKGNWRLLVSECTDKFGAKYVDKKGNEFVFFGLVHDNEDYYYGMSGASGLHLLSCVGNIEGHGFTLSTPAQEQTDGS
jgi:hypothetical protein